MVFSLRCKALANDRILVKMAVANYVTTDRFALIRVPAVKKVAVERKLSDVEVPKTVIANKVLVIDAVVGSLIDNMVFSLRCKALAGDRILMKMAVADYVTTDRFALVRVPAVKKVAVKQRLSDVEVPKAVIANKVLVIDAVVGSLIDNMVFSLRCKALANDRILMKMAVADYVTTDRFALVRVPAVKKVAVKQKLSDVEVPKAVIANKVLVIDAVVGSLIDNMVFSLRCKALANDRILMKMAVADYVTTDRFALIRVPAVKKQAVKQKLSDVEVPKAVIANKVLVVDAVVGSLIDNMVFSLRCKALANDRILMKMAVADYVTTDRFALVRVLPVKKVVVEQKLSDVEVPKAVIAKEGSLH
ncbi:hypothetical protein BC829DRAFT_95465 [Chytridium lagenaria]|nr:hypothetical protein BC829DRAFT_95465 [Chytridium lagenaria]